MSPRPVTLSYIITALNEELNISAAVDTVIAATGDRFTDYEIILVDDGSTDRTGAIMDELAARNPRIRAVHNEVNLGLGGAYKRGIQEARMEYVMWIPGDNGELPDAVGLILDKVGQADIVLPYPHQQQRPLLRRITSKGFVIICNLLFRLRVRYYNGLVVHRTEYIRNVRIGTNSFAYQAEAVIQLLRSGCTSVDVGYRGVPQTSNNTKALRPENLVGVIVMLLRLAVTRPWHYRKVIARPPAS